MDGKYFGNSLLTDSEKLFNTSIFISGSYGMLASFFVFYLIYLNEEHNANIKIICQGRSHEKMASRFGDYLNKDFFIEINDDICSELDVKGEIDYIVHAASLASLQYYNTRPVDVLMPNAMGTYHLLELARKKNVKSFLFLSTGEVYGNIPPSDTVYDETTGFGALDSMNIRNCYSESKRMGELLCKAYNVQYGINALVTRLAHTYGPTMDLINDKRVFTEFVKNIVNNEDIVIKSSGTTERIFCYAADAVEAFILMMTKGQGGEAYNLYNNYQRVQIRELAERLVALYPEKNLKVVFEKRDDENYLECPVEKPIRMSTEKLESLGWKPKFSIEEGFKLTIDYFESIKKN